MSNYEYPQEHSAATAFDELPPHMAEFTVDQYSAERADSPLDGNASYSGDTQQYILATEDYIHNAPLSVPAKTAIQEIAHRIPKVYEEPGLYLWNLHRARLLKNAADIALRYPEGGQVAGEVILENKLHGHQLPPTGSPRQAPQLLEQPCNFLKLYLGDPQLAESVAERRIIGFHGTRSGALPGILKHGLMSERDARQHPGYNVVTGERIFSPEQGQKGIHFAELRSPHSIARYAPIDQPLSPRSLQEQIHSCEADSVQDAAIYGSNNLLARAQQTIVEDLNRSLRQLREHPTSLESRLLRANYPVAIGVDTRGLAIVDHQHRKWTQSIVDARLASGKPGIDMNPGTDIDGEYIAYGTFHRDKIAVIGAPAEQHPELSAITRWLGMSCKIVDVSLLTKQA